MAALAVTVLVVGAGLSFYFLTNGDPNDNAQDSAASNSAGGDSASNGSAASGGQSGPPSSTDLGLPAGPELSTTVLVAPHDVDGNVDLYVVDSTTGATQTRLTTDESRQILPLIAPDRTSVIYVSRQEFQELWVVGTDGSGARRLFEEIPADCDRVRGRAAWNPVDPTMLAAVCLDAAGTASLQLPTLSGARIRTLDTGLPTYGGLAFSPDGTALVFWGNTDVAAGDGPLYVQATEGNSAPVQLTDAAVIGNAESAIWSPDGTPIAFQVLVDASTSPVNTDVAVMNADGSNLLTLDTGDGVDQDPVWSPDGSLIVFRSDRDDGAGVRVERLWVMNADGSEVRLLSTEGSRGRFRRGLGEPVRVRAAQDASAACISRSRRSAVSRGSSTCMTSSPYSV